MLFCFFFFFNDTATTEIYTLSLHDALPICFTEGGASGFRGHRGSLLFVEGAELGDDGGRRAVLGEIAVPTGSAAAEDLSDGRNGFRWLGSLAVPLGVVLHERDALALDGMGDDERRAVGVGLALMWRLSELIAVVTVDLDHRPAERLPLLAHRLQGEDVRH